MTNDQEAGLRTLQCPDSRVNSGFSAQLSLDNFDTPTRRVVARGALCRPRPKELSPGSIDLAVRFEYADDTDRWPLAADTGLLTPHYRVSGSGMRLWVRLLITGLVVAGMGAGAWFYANRHPLRRQWMCYRVGTAGGYEEAKAGFRWFESGPNREARLGELVAKWGTGNEQFDLFLARYVGDAESSEALRERFSLEFGWRDEMLDRWARYWAWQADPDPDREIASILSYLDTLAGTVPRREISWREVLDLQAIFCLTGRSELARRLKPTNWRERYQQWQQRRPSTLPSVSRPAMPLAN